MALAHGDPRWTFGLHPNLWQRRTFCASGHSIALLLIPLVATSLMALDAALAETPPPLPPSTVTSEISINIKGMLQYRPTRPIGKWMLTSVNGSSTSYTLPNQPVDALSGQEIAAGRSVSLTCFLLNVLTTKCSNITDARMYLAASARTPANFTLRMLVMVVSLSNSSECESQGGAKVTQVKDAFLGPDGYADFFESCSYKKMVFDRQKFTVVSTVVPCSEEINKCNEDAIARAAKLQLLADIQVASFSHYAYVLPDNLAPKCGWVGLAEIPGAQAWFTPDTEGIFSKGTVMQEILHNFLIHHGWRNGVEYEDESTCMGDGNSCPSAPELWRLGWATPLVQLNSSFFPLATYMEFILPATYLGPTGVMIKIQPDWLGVLYTKNMYLALRVKAAGDRDLLEEFNGKLNIHEIDRFIDNSLLANDDPKSSFTGAISPRTSITRFDFKLHLLVGVFDNMKSTIILTICRFVTGPNDCNFASPPGQARTTPMQPPASPFAPSPPPSELLPPPLFPRPPSLSPQPIPASSPSPLNLPILIPPSSQSPLPSPLSPPRPTPPSPQSPPPSPLTPPRPRPPSPISPSPSPPNPASPKPLSPLSPLPSPLSPPRPTPPSPQSPPPSPLTPSRPRPPSPISPSPSPPNPASPKPLSPLSPLPSPLSPPRPTPPSPRSPPPSPLTPSRPRPPSPISPSPSPPKPASPRPLSPLSPLPSPLSPPRPTPPSPRSPPSFPPYPTRPRPPSPLSPPTPNAIEFSSSFSQFAGPNVGVNKSFSDQQAMAIWVNAGAASSASTLIAATFTTTITITGQATQALLDLIVDDIADVFINGAYITTVKWGWRYLGDYTDRPIKISLPLGTSTLSLRVQNTVGAAGVAAYLSSSDGKTVLARTNSAWTYTIDAQDAPRAIEFSSSFSQFAGPNVGVNKSFSDKQAMAIWVNAGAASSASTLIAATFTTTITITGQATQALLDLIVDDIADVFINGAYITTVKWGWRYLGDYTDRPIKISLPLGTSTLSLRVQNTVGAAGVAAYLSSSDGKTVLARTNSAWTYTIDAQDAPRAIEFSSSFSQFAGPNVGVNKSFSDKQAMAIWVNAGAASSASTLIAATFTTTITITGQATQALLDLIVDDIADVFINGAYITTVKWGWRYLGDYTDRPIKISLPLGTSTLSLRVQNTVGAAGVAAYLSSSDGKTVLARTNSAWTYTIDAQDAPRAIEFSSSFSQFAGPNVGVNKSFSDKQAMAIWVNAGAASSASTLIAATFTTTITITGQATQALLDLIVDDIADVFINGAYITTVKWGWRYLGDYTDRPIKISLPLGTSTLSLRVQNTVGAAGVAAYLSSSDGKTVLARTNSAWTYTIDAQDAPRAIEFSSSFSQFAGPNVGVNKPFRDQQAMAIWVNAGAASSASTLIAATFTTTITITGQATQALLDLIVDDIADVFINGAYITTVKWGWRYLGDYTDRPIKISLPLGTSTLSLRVQNTVGAAGVAAYLSSSDGKTVLARTNSGWTYTIDAQNAPCAIELGSSFSQFAGPNVGVNKPFRDQQAMAIWVNAGASSNASTLTAATFTTTIITGQATQAVLDLIVDDIADVFINGAYITTVKWGWRYLGDYTDRPIKISLPLGTSTLSLRVQNTGGAAGVAAYLSSSDGKTVLARTNSAWTYTV
ncbi:hypothetical protein VaNZ11_010194 [Volvox africanus]|uniref:Peptidase M11 gametolysin domain-containing protein n=1 Tax=Volvox africanus TaxID=51714 RepID=A0ABQ5S914_9CHLO|nr:hypothetical protein VaNZ11_010194 [Volvox africanus]